MVARVTRARMRTDMTDEGLAMWHDTVLPALTARPGFHGAQVLASGDQGIAVVLFDTRENADAADGDAAVRAAREKFAPFFVSAPEAQLMEIVADSRR